MDTIKSQMKEKQGKEHKSLKNCFIAPFHTLFCYLLKPVVTSWLSQLVCMATTLGRTSILLEHLQGTALLVPTIPHFGQERVVHPYLSTSINIYFPFGFFLRELCLAIFDIE